MLREGRPVGVLVMTPRGAGRSPSSRSSWSRLLPTQSAIAIENVRLFEEVEARTRELAHSLEDLQGRAGPPGPDREARLARPAHRRHRARDQEPAQLRQQFRRAFGRADRRTAGAARRGAARRRGAREVGELDRLLKGNLDKVVQHGKRANSIVKNMLLHSRAGLGRAPAGRHQCARRGEPQSRLSRRARREAGLQHHAGAVASTRRPARSTSSRRRSRGCCSI